MGIEQSEFRSQKEIEIREYLEMITIDVILPPGY
jgi:hypothetical protein